MFLPTSSDRLPLIVKCAEWTPRVGKEGKGAEVAQGNKGSSEYESYPSVFPNLYAHTWYFALCYQLKFSEPW